MLDVFFTVDVEIWCDGWHDIDAKFAESFGRYIYGVTAGGHFGLPFQLKLLSDHGLHGVFFVEPLFAARFGIAPLEEIVGLIAEAGHDVELHLHTEWVDEAGTALLAGSRGKRQHLRQYSQDEQSTLIAHGKALLGQARARGVSAFRAGSFAFNRDTLAALNANGIEYDSSYNASMFGADSGVMPGRLLSDVTRVDGIYEYPVTVFSDGAGSLRHAQLGACSYAELESLLWQALQAGRKSFVIVCHNFELLNLAKDRGDEVMVKRFRRLCSFLDRNRDSFRMQGFRGPPPPIGGFAPTTELRSSVWQTGVRMFQQAYRRRYG